MFMEIGFVFVQKKVTPVVQVVFAFIIGLVGMSVCKLVSFTPGTEYFVAYLAIIFFALINIVVSLAFTSFLRYTMPSFYLYVLLVAALFLLAKFFSGISIWALTEYRMMLLPVTLFFFMASIFVRGIRFIYEAAEKGDL